MYNTLHRMIDWYLMSFSFHIGYFMVLSFYFWSKLKCPERTIDL